MRFWTLCLLVSALSSFSQLTASSHRCSEVITGLDGDLVWQTTDRISDLKAAVGSRIIVTYDGAFVKGLNVQDGRVRWDFRVSEYFLPTQAPILNRDGNRLYLIGVKKIVELNAETGAFVASYSVPFIQRPLQHDIVMGLTFPHRSNLGGNHQKMMNELLEQASTDRSFHLLDDWFVINFEEGIRFLNRKGGAWKEKALAGFIGAHHSGGMEPHLFADRDQIMTSFPGPKNKKAKLEAFRFNYPDATFIREWSFELNHETEKTDYQFASNANQVFAVTYVPTSKEDGMFSKRLIALDRNLGELIWETPLQSLTWQNHQLMAKGSVLIYVIGDQVLGVDTLTGNAIWAFEIPETSTVRHQIYIQSFDDNRIIAQRGDRAYLLKASDGKLESDLKLIAPGGKDALFTLYPLDGRHLLIRASEGQAKDRLSLVRIR
jgi:outer membrane protein assembly factor BamB